VIASKSLLFFSLPGAHQGQSNRIVERAGRRKGSVEKEKGWNRGRLEKKKKKKH